MYLHLLLYFAEWTDVFYDTYNTNGIDQAVIFALSEAKSPGEIIEAALLIEDIEEPRLIQALFCALVLPGSIYEAAEANNITEETVAKGYELSLAVCAREMEENLNIAINPTPQFPELSPSKRIRRPVYASPWTFE